MIQCEICEKAEAEVLCCADEAVLCKECDEKVHSANKLFQKHHRVALIKSSSSSSSSSSASNFPLCDICRERNGYLFCLEDRALLCSYCDESIHIKPSSHAHQRFLIAGVKVSHQSCPDVENRPTSLVTTAATTTTPYCPLDDDLAFFEFSDIESSKSNQSQF